MSMTLIQRFANVENPGSLANRLRSRRFRLFERLISGLPRPVRIVDLGGTESFWLQRGWSQHRDVEITIVNIKPQKGASTDWSVVCGDATRLSQFADRQFDVAFSNSVIEHLETPQRQAAMASEMKRIAPAMWLQTPNFWFPIEPHFHVPGWQWLPAQARTSILQRRRCGWRGPCPNRDEAASAVREVRLLTRRSLRRLFPNASIRPERFAGLVKSWIVHEGFGNADEREDPHGMNRFNQSQRSSRAIAAAVVEGEA